MTLRQWRPRMAAEQLVLIICAYMALCFNGAFWHAALAGHEAGRIDTWKFVAGTFIAMCGLHAALLVALSGRWTIKPLLAVLVVVTALAAYHMDHYAVFMDTEMLGNILHTEYREAREFLTGDLLVSVLLRAAPPLLLLWRVEVPRRGWGRASLVRIATMMLMLLLAGGGLLLAFRDLSALMRNQKEVRYLVTPGNYLYAAARALLADARQAQHGLTAIGADARVAPRAAGTRPRLLVIVVGETVRAQNWGLNGYARDTTPELRALQVVNFNDVQSCGTATEVSLPCMFAPVGRRDYDEARIRGQQSLLHVLDHAGIATLWRDNQTGCKGVCTGLPFQQWNDARIAGLCKDGSCYDEVLLHDLQRDVEGSTGDMVVVLHPIGNHGPSYYARYPDRFRHYLPTCDSPELGQCSGAQILNAYDNAVRYADHFVAEAIRLLERQTGHDAALIYVSDHGESLGEHGLFLHGVPWAIAPEQQTRVPMITWLAPGFARDEGIDLQCLRARSGRKLSHDSLFHSVLGLLDVRTALYEPSLDLYRDCQGAHRAVVAAR